MEQGPAPACLPRAVGPRKPPRWRLRARAMLIVPFLGIPHPSPQHVMFGRVGGECPITKSIANHSSSSSSSNPVPQRYFYSTIKLSVAVGCNSAVRQATLQTSSPAIVFVGWTQLCRRPNSLGQSNVFFHRKSTSNKRDRQTAQKFHIAAYREMSRRQRVNQSSPFPSGCAENITYYL